MRLPREFLNKLLQNDAPTLGEKRQKSERFARDVLQFATFCHTSRLKVHFFTFRTRSRAGTPKIRRSSEKVQKMHYFSKKRRFTSKIKVATRLGF